MSKQNYLSLLRTFNEKYKERFLELRKKRVKNFSNKEAIEWKNIHKDNKEYFKRRGNIIAYSVVIPSSLIIAGYIGLIGWLFGSKYNFNETKSSEPIVKTIQSEESIDNLVEDEINDLKEEVDSKVGDIKDNVDEQIGELSDKVDDYKIKQEEEQKQIEANRDEVNQYIIERFSDKNFGLGFDEAKFLFNSKYGERLAEILWNSQEIQSIQEEQRPFKDSSEFLVYIQNLYDGKYDPESMNFEARAFPDTSKFLPGGIENAVLVVDETIGKKVIASYEQHPGKCDDGIFSIKYHPIKPKGCEKDTKDPMQEFREIAKTGLSEYIMENFDKYSNYLGGAQ